MKAGRPAAIRSRLAIGVGGTMTEAQREAVKAVLLDEAIDHPPEDLLDRIDHAYAAYKADVTALDAPASRRGELDDVAAIDKDCRALLALRESGPARVVAERLRQRLLQFPPTVEVHLAEMKINLWPRLERLRASLMRPASVLIDDLEQLAAVCAAVVPRLDLPNQTKPPAIARGRFVQSLRDALGTVEFRDLIVADLLEALDVKAPKRL